MVYNINMCLFSLAVNFPENRKKVHPPLLPDPLFMCAKRQSNENQSLCDVTKGTDTLLSQLVAEAPSIPASLWQTSFFWSTFKHVEGDM